MTLNKLELEILDYKRICGELTPTEEKLLEAYKELEESQESLPGDERTKADLREEIENLEDAKYDTETDLIESEERVDKLKRELEELQGDFERSEDKLATVVATLKETARELCIERQKAESAHNVVEVLQVNAKKLNLVTRELVYCEETTIDVNKLLKIIDNK